MQLIAEKVRKQFGSVTALDGLSLSVPADSVFGILGMNGAGKTTLFRLFVGLDTPDEGTVRIGGEKVADTGCSIRGRIGYLPERIGFPAELTGREVLEFHARMRGGCRGKRIDEVLETVGLVGADARRGVAGYSNGMRRRLGLATAILSDPEVLILDEPTAGLDPRGMIEFHRIVGRARQHTGATLLLASHVLSEVERLCDHVAILDDGATAASGPVGELIGAHDLEVVLRPATGDVDALLAVADDFGTITRRAGAVTVCTPVDGITDLFARLHDTVELADVTVERQGLQQFFRQNADTACADHHHNPVPQNQHQ